MRVYEESRPPGPGEEPAFARNMRKHIQLPWKSAGIPIGASADGWIGWEISGLVLELETLLMKISGKGQPGTYLLGYRKIGSSTRRNYARIQVTGSEPQHS